MGIRTAFYKHFNRAELWHDIVSDIIMRKQRILIIEDEFELCMLLKLHFLEKDYDVEMTYNLKDGKERLKTYNPDIVYLDNNLPDGLGWNCVAEISAFNPAIIINLMTGDMPDDEKLSDNLNLYILMKPLSIKEIDLSLRLNNNN
jgi:DNA-binding response OmpR family regulator